MEHSTSLAPHTIQGQKKAITFSYDDGVTQDIRLISLLDKYGLKATFNLNSGLLGLENHLIREGVRVSHTKVKPEDVRHIYAGHEIAAHTLTHPMLPDINEDDEIIRQVEEDRQNLSRLAGYEVTGMAYPGGGVNYNQRVAGLIESSTGIQYARTTVCCHCFSPQRDLYQFQPTVYHIMDMDRLFEDGRRFLEMDSSDLTVMYIWGHSYEFDIHDTWGRFEDFLQLISDRNDIFYGTNKEILLSDAYKAAAQSTQCADK